MYYVFVLLMYMCTSWWISIIWQMCINKTCLSQNWYQCYYVLYYRTPLNDVKVTYKQERSYPILRHNHTLFYLSHTWWNSGHRWRWHCNQSSYPLSSPAHLVDDQDEDSRLQMGNIIEKYNEIKKIRKYYT